MSMFSRVIVPALMAALKDKLGEPAAEAGPAAGETH